ncbi:hypothetical protein [Phormidium sp. FACHB-1136]|uniref:hypothetical protein n=1 Tax=Phormidium sp. FACHB-1136 TaxID=2692848 RepID=UPI00168220AD|nr:hypothetical protein [Phormidium sp. FACHB-1136]MBD2428754.1 hypothetical protein [Phormidium sp. FACHB-1136]
MPIIFSCYAEASHHQVAPMTDSNEFVGEKTSAIQPDQNRIFAKGNRVIAFASGGSFLGAMVGQIPGAVLLGVLGAMFALVYNPETANAGGKE